MSDSLRPIDPGLFDESVPASDDFFRHVNGGWLDTHPVPPEYPAWGAFHEVTFRNQAILHELLEQAAAEPGPLGSPSQLVGDYFVSAMDEELVASAGLGPLDSLLSRIEAAESIEDIRGVSLELQHLSIGVFLDIGITADFENSDAYLVYLGQGGLGLPERDYYTRDDEQSVALRAAYVDHIAKQFGNLGESAESAARAANAILAFETRLAEPSYTAQQLRDVSLTLNRHEVSALDDLMPAFRLSAYAEELGVTQPSVNIDNAGFFSALETTLADTPLGTLRDYLRWHLVRSFASSLPKAFEEESFAFYGRTLGGQQEMKPRWKRALDIASADIGEAVAQLFVEATFSESAKERCEEMVDHLLSAMGAAIRDADWMTAATREQALEKLAGFGYKIGYPDRWRDYSKLTIGRVPFAENRMRAARFEYERQFGRLNEPVDKGEWGMPAHSVNAYYHPLMNEIVFPAGILQPPFFYADADDAVNFGAIGVVIAHEITHGFDDQGSHFDAHGHLREWWTEADRAEFDRRSKLLVEQFGSFEVAEGLRVNGELTLGENIADLGGLTVAFNGLGQVLTGDEPLVDGFTPQQRFFLSYATIWRINTTDEYTRLLVNIDPHSPGRYRVNGQVRNLAAFGEAFGIEAGSPMLLPAEERAKIW